MLRRLAAVPPALYLLVACMLVLSSCGRAEVESVETSASTQQPAPYELPDGYERYVDEQFGFSLAYPETLLAVAGDVEDGNGQRFLSADSTVSMMAIGHAMDSSAAASLSVEDLFDERIRARREQPGVITYSLRGDRAFVISGTSGDLIYYEKTLLYDDAVARLELTYPIGRRVIMDQVVTAISPSFGGRITAEPSP